MTAMIQTCTYLLYILVTFLCKDGEAFINQQLFLNRKSISHSISHPQSLNLIQMKPIFVNLHSIAVVLGRLVF